MSGGNRGIMSDVEWRSPGGRLFVGVSLAVLVLVSIAVLFPFFYSFTAGLKTSTEVFKPGLRLWPEIPHWENYTEAWQRLNLPGMFKNTFIVAAGGVLGQVIVSTLAAYSLSRLNPFGKRFIQMVILITLAIPGIAYLVPRYIAMTDLPVLHISLVNNYWGLWIPYATNAFMILVLKNAFDSIPRELYDAAAVDGASDLRMFFTFTLPLSQGIIVVLALLSFIGLWGDFLMPLLILRESSLQTVSVRLYTLTRAFPANLFLAGSFIAMLPPTIAAIFLQRYMKGGLTI